MTNNEKFKLSEYDETIRLVLESGGGFRLYPRGTSMLPLIRQGVDSVVLVKAEGRLKRDDIAFYQRNNGQYILHRVYRVTESGYTMLGDNQINLESGIEDRQIIGVVSKIFRKDKCVEKSTPLYRLYLLLWKSILIRRVVFKLRRIKQGTPAN